MFRKIVDGISNFQIEEAFKNINDEDIDDNFVGEFPLNCVNKFIEHASMISEMEGKYLARGGLIGGVYLALNQKWVFSFSIRFVLID